MRYQAVLFDFDYTLGDSTIPITIGYQKGLTAMGHPAPTVEQVRPTIGLTLQDGYTMLTGDTDEERRSEFRALFQQAVGQKAIDAGDMTMIRETRFFPGAAELLTALKDAGIPIGIVSTKMRATLEAIFRHRGMGSLFTLIVGGEDVSRPKPDPQGLQWALDRLGLAPEQVLFCGDTVIDAGTAQAAGVDFCAVLNGTTPADAFADFPSVRIAPDLTDLKHWLEL